MKFLSRKFLIAIAGAIGTMVSAVNPDLGPEVAKWIAAISASYIAGESLVDSTRNIFNGLNKK